MAVLFALGSFCFLVGSVASQWASSSRPAIGVTFFVGSISFTSRSPRSVIAGHASTVGHCRGGSLPSTFSARSQPAFASLLKPSSGLPVSARIASAGTSLGGICFLIGSLLLIPEAGRVKRAAAPESQPSPVSGDAPARSRS
jgi:hypothetical protein